MKSFLTLVLSCIVFLSVYSMPTKEKPLDVDEISYDASFNAVYEVAEIPVILVDNTVTYHSSPGTEIHQKFNAVLLANDLMVRQRIKHHVPFMIGKPLPSLKNYEGFRQLKA